ncbi:MAG: hypothetical protein MJY60_04205 [Bacteroidales bacterium]|nr:hypothetical protein [Bacteroidales bacterium]
MDCIQIEDREYRIEFNFNAIGDFLDAKGYTLSKLERFADLSANDIVTLICCGIHEGERLEGRECDLQPKDIGAVMTGDDITAAIELINKHYTGKALADGGEGVVESKKKIRWTTK